MLNVSPETIAINGRFFEAIDLLVQNKVIRGLKTFSDKYGLNQGNLVSVRNNQNKYIVRADLLSYLVRDYNVSAEWLLLGKGTPFNNQ